MQSVATGDPIVQCVSQSGTWLCCAETAGWIKVLFGLETSGPSAHGIEWKP